MIGTIIIAVIGYGFALACVVVMGSNAWIFFTTDKRSAENDRRFKGFFLCLVMALAAAAITRALAGGW